MQLQVTLLEVKLLKDRGIIESQNLPLEEKVYLKKDWLGWRVVEPPTKWYHWVFGSPRTLFALLIFMFIAFLLYLGVNEMVSSYKEIAAAPCNYCEVCTAAKLNISTIIK